MIPLWAVICFVLDGITIGLGIGLIIWYFTEGKDL